ncbi:uncharacterized protein [Cardiocondyla obscurior]|uniref:uncharacterized protein n=1 Tax=Cardiocondyla obscurior TaxID=286306 RepID=UPI0039658B26
MAEKSKFILQKRTSLKTQITTLTNLFTKGSLDNVTLKLRLNRLTVLYNAYEEYNDELALIDPNDAHEAEFKNIQERFYEIAGRIETQLSSVNSIGTITSSASSHSPEINPSPISSHKRRIKLPEAPLPAYEVKRVLISRHLSMILNLPNLEKETSGLSKLADDAQQHIASLTALNITVGPEIIVHIIESKLPKHTIDKWEATLERDEVPTLDKMYEFLYKTAVSASKRERSKPTENDRHKFEPPNKRKRFSSANQTFVVSEVPNCMACKIKKHPLYRCDTFRTMPIQGRRDVVKNAKVCYVCLRSHRPNACKFTSCPICQKRHNVLLHPENPKINDQSETKPSVIVKKD